jgi:hypothetical protein
VRTITPFGTHWRTWSDDGRRAPPVVPLSTEQGPGQSAVPFRDGRPFFWSPRLELKPKGPAFQRLTTISNDFWAALIDEPMSRLQGVRNTALEVARSRIIPGQLGARRCQNK